MKNRTGIRLALMGACLLAGAATLGIYNLWDSRRAGTEAGRIKHRLEEMIEQNAETKTTGREVYGDRDAEAADAGEIDGNNYIGIIEIPSADISLPVMYDWDYERLKSSPCRYSGSTAADDLVICAHNYETHFGPLLRVSPGEDVYFTDVEGVRIHYVVTNLETVQPKEISYMTGDSNNSGPENDWDLTLFTCNLGGQTRCTVRCDRVPDASG